MAKANASVYGKLPEFKLGKGSSDQFCIVFMGTLMVLDNKVTYSSQANARRALSHSISLEYNSNSAIQKKYDTVGKFRKSLEDNKVIQIIEEKKVVITAKVSGS